MRKALSWAFFVLLFSFVAACGRDDVARADTCEVDDDCESGACIDGLCDTEAQPNSANGMTDGCPEVACEEGFVCDPSTGSCVDGSCQEEGDTCVQPMCGDEGCVSVPCDLGCKGYEEQVGCSCVTVGCMSDDDCGDFFCGDDSTCRGCTEADCAEGDYCTPDGSCEVDTRCMSDADCSAREECVDDRCEERAGCVLDGDCGDGELCLGGSCTLAPECSENDPCPDGFECVGETCFEIVCRGPDDCAEGEVCEAGECQDAPVAASCVVTTPSQTIVENQTVLLEAFAYDDDGAPITSSFTWTSTDPAVAAVSGQTAVGGTDGGTTTVTAALADPPIDCMGSAELTNPGPPPANNFRATVFDADLGVPVAGAEVIIDGQSAVTNASGVATLPQPTGAFDVTIASSDHNWVSLVGITSTDVRIPLTVKQGTGPIAGFDGQFDTSLINSSGDVTLGLAGSSLTGGLLDVNLTRLLGDSFVRRLNIPGIVDTDIPLPGGVVVYGGAFGFTIDLKEEYYATAPDGGRIAWGLAGQVPISDLIQLFMGGGGGTADVLSLILPLFNRFDHGSNSVVLNALPRVSDSADFDGDGDTSEMLPDYASFPSVGLTPSVRQSLVTDIAISRFPTLSSGQANAAILVGGATQGNVGFVPLGISATSDENEDGFPDSRRLTVAPPYGAITGSRFAVLALAFGDGGGVGPGGFDLPDEFSVALWNNQSLPASLSLGTFPDGSQVTLDRTARTVDITADAGPLYRVRIVGAERAWDVWTTGPAGAMGTFAHNVSVPAAPAGQTDFLTDGEVFVDAIQTNVSLDQLVRASGVGLTNAGLVSTAFNRTAAP